MAVTKMSLKLLIDKKAKKVLFAECGKEFFDFLFNLLSLPLSTVIRLVENPGTVGCMGNLYQSLENLKRVYMEPKDKHAILNRYVSTHGNGVSLLLPHTTQQPVRTWLNSCVFSDHTAVAENMSTPCPICERPMSYTVNFLSYQNANAQSIFKPGYVKGLFTYMVMDDLSVTPMSTVSVISLLNKCSVADTGVLEERLVDIGIEEGLDLLKASLHPEGALTEVFIVNKESSDVSNSTSLCGSAATK